jgi:NADH-quinone oxidoreductase subunit C
MEPLEIAEKVKSNFPGEVVDMTQFRDQVFVSIKREKVLDICHYLHDDPEINMDYLADLCGVDYPDRKQRFEVIYNLFSIKNKHRLILKALLSEDELSVDSVVSIWSGANWHERETCDMYGIVFNGHPDLRRILMPDDWEGYPLRKDYPLKGPDREYKAFDELKDLHSHDNEWSIQQPAKDKLI